MALDANTTITFSSFTLREDLQDAANDSHSSEHKKQRRTAAEIAAEIAALPLEGKTDEFSGRDHDRVLYGEDRAK